MCDARFASFTVLGKLCLSFFAFWVLFIFAGGRGAAKEDTVFCATIPRVVDFEEG